MLQFYGNIAETIAYAHQLIPDHFSPFMWPGYEASFRMHQNNLERTGGKCSAVDSDCRVAMFSTLANMKCVCATIQKVLGRCRVNTTLCHTYVYTA